MMYNINHVLKSSVCAFCKAIYESESLDEEDFIDSLYLFLTEDKLINYLNEYMTNIDYDIENIENICMDTKLKNKTFETNEIINCCKLAHLHTLNNDKTINVEAFIDNLVKEFIKI